MPKTLFQKIISVVLDVLFPKNALDKKIDELSPEKLLHRLMITQPWDESDFVALFDYTDHLIKHMIWSMKFRGNKRIANLFASIASDYLVEEFSERALFEGQTNPLIIPIPLSKKRLRERGYNQSARVAQYICAHNDTFSICDNVLVRIKNTLPQTSLKNKKTRAENVHGVFAVVNLEKIRGKNIILLDDVTTTGSTLKEARGALRKAGARSVLCVALAH